MSYYNSQGNQCNVPYYNQYAGPYNPPQEPARSFYQKDYSNEYSSTPYNNEQYQPQQLDPRENPAQFNTYPQHYNPQQYTVPQYTPEQDPPQYTPQQYAAPQYNPQIAPSQYPPAPQYNPPEYTVPQYTQYDPPPQYNPPEYTATQAPQYTAPQYTPQFTPQQCTTPQWTQQNTYQYTPQQYDPPQYSPQYTPSQYITPQYNVQYSDSQNISYGQPDYQAGFNNTSQYNLPQSDNTQNQWDQWPTQNAAQGFNADQQLKPQYNNNNVNQYTPNQSPGDKPEELKPGKPQLSTETPPSAPQQGTQADKPQKQQSAGVDKPQKQQSTEVDKPQKQQSSQVDKPHKNSAKSHPYVNCFFEISGQSLAKKDFLTRSSDPYIVVRLPYQAFATALLKDNSAMATKIFGAGFKAGTLLITQVELLPLVLAGMAFETTFKTVYNTMTKTHAERESFQEVYVSEYIKRNLNPTWQPFHIVFHESFVDCKDAGLVIECYDWDRTSPSDLIGECAVNLSTLLSSGQSMSFTLLDKKGRSGGTLQIKSHLVGSHTPMYKTPTNSGGQSLVNCRFSASAKNLPRKDLISRSSDPYIVVSMPFQAVASGKKESNDGYDAGFLLGKNCNNIVDMFENGITDDNDDVLDDIWEMTTTYALKKATSLHDKRTGCQEVFVSKPVMRNLNPTWPPFDIMFHESFAKHKSASIFLDIWDYDRCSPSDFIGSCQVNINSLLVGPKSFTLVDDHGKPSGSITIQCNIDNSCITGWRR